MTFPRSSSVILLLAMWSLIDRTTIRLTTTFLAHHKMAAASSKEHGERTPHVVW